MTLWWPRGSAKSLVAFMHVKVFAPSELQFLRISYCLVHSEKHFVFTFLPKATEISKYKHGANCKVKFKSLAQLLLQI